MDLTDVVIIKGLLQKHHTAPNKILGQHFLVSKNVLQKIVESADLKKTDTVLEVGPGLGTLTKELTKRAGRVIAVEKDRALIPALKETLAEHKNVEIVVGDILKFNLTSYKLKAHDHKIVADIPYYLTSRFLRLFLETPHQPSLMVLLIQKEVAERILAKPPHATILSNAVGYYAAPNIVARVQKSAFFPQPGVDSAIVKLDIIRKFNKRVDSAFFLLLKMVFSTPRKQILHTLSIKYPRSTIQNLLKKAKIGETRRPQEIELDGWMRLVKLIESTSTQCHIT